MELPILAEAEAEAGTQITELLILVVTGGQVLLLFVTLVLNGVLAELYIQQVGIRTINLLLAGHTQHEFN
jgi:hypothetical protein